MEYIYEILTSKPKFSHNVQELVSILVYSRYKRSSKTNGLKRYYRKTLT